MYARRQFLEVLGVATATACVGCGGGGEPAGAAPAQPSAFPVGKVGDFPVGSLTIVAGKATIVGRDAAGIYAFSAMCTHAHCDISTTGTVSVQGLICGTKSCGHGSTYDVMGNVTMGPAAKPLPHFYVTTTGDTVTIDPGTTVPSDARAMG